MKLDRESRIERAREARQAATLARRGSDAWKADGAAFVAAQAAEAEAAAKRAADQRAADKLARDAAKPVGERELERAIKLAEAAIAEAALDTGYHPDVIAHDIVEAVCLDLRPALAAAVKRAAL